MNLTMNVNDAVENGLCHAQNLVFDKTNFIQVSPDFFPMTHDEIININNNVQPVPSPSERAGVFSSSETYKRQDRDSYSFESDASTTKMNLLKVFETNLPESPEIDNYLSLPHPKISKPESSSNSESEERISPILYIRKRRPKQSNKLDLSKKCNIDALPSRVSTRVRKPVLRNCNGKTAENILVPNFYSEQEPDISSEIVNENILRLKSRNDSNIISAVSNHRNKLLKTIKKTNNSIHLKSTESKQNKYLHLYDINKKCTRNTTKKQNNSNKRLVTLKNANVKNSKRKDDKINRSSNKKVKPSAKVIVAPTYNTRSVTKGTYDLRKTNIKKGNQATYKNIAKLSFLGQETAKKKTGVKDKTKIRASKKYYKQTRKIHGRSKSCKLQNERKKKKHVRKIGNKKSTKHMVCSNIRSGRSKVPAAELRTSNRLKCNARLNNSSYFLRPKLA